ncbi:MAG: ATP synthase subunit I [Candidatus Adiutrix sp.]|jgi:hypothetical protein|nr:ATP synthase subunit I [Candidatus Adiutrix sp.]
MANDLNESGPKMIPDPKLGEAVAGARRVRAGARWSALALSLAGLAGGGPSWFLGVVLGGLLVEINLNLLVRTLSRAAAWQGRSLRPTLTRFYLAFGATAVACVLVIRGGWGQPLAFLLGLLSFVAGLFLALLSFLIKKPQPPEETP